MATSPAPRGDRVPRGRRPGWIVGVAVVRRAVAGFALTALLGSALLAGHVGSSGSAGGGRHDAERLADGATTSSSVRVAEVMETHRCSFGALDDPARVERSPEALLRTPDGRMQVVPAARGWAAYAGEQPGTLVATCLGPRDRDGR